MRAYTPTLSCLIVAPVLLLGRFWKAHHVILFTPIFFEKVHHARLFFVRFDKNSIWPKVKELDFWQKLDFEIFKNSIFNLKFHDFGVKIPQKSEKIKNSILTIKFHSKTPKIRPKSPKTRSENSKTRFESQKTRFFGILVECCLQEYRPKKKAWRTEAVDGSNESS